MSILRKQKLIISLLMLFFVASFSTTYAFWASSVEGSSNTGNGVIGVGLWVPDGFVGVAQQEGNGMIRLDQIGTTVGTKFYPLVGQPYIQMTDIALTGNFTPIGFSSKTPFGGEFHGNGFSITGLNINITQSTGNNIYAGLFYQNEGTISRVSLIGVDITVNKSLSGAGTDELHVGGLAGQNSGFIFNSYVTGSITGSMSRTVPTGSGGGNQTSILYASVGGLVGTNTGDIGVSHSNASITSYASVTATTNNRTTITHSHAGGLVGKNTSTGSVSKSYSTGEVTANALTNNSGNRSNQSFANSYAGGLVGINELGVVENSFSAVSFGSIQSKTQSNSNVTANRYYGHINGFGVSSNSYYLDTQLISGTKIPTSTDGNSIENTLDPVVHKEQYQLRQQSFLTSTLEWLTNDWIFDTTHYPRLKRNKY